MKRLKSLIHELAECRGGRFDAIDAFTAAEVEDRAGAGFESDVGVLGEEVEERLVEEIAGLVFGLGLEDESIGELRMVVEIDVLPAKCTADFAEESFRVQVEGRSL